MSSREYELIGFSDETHDSFDFLVYSVGYERRSRYVASQFSKQANKILAFVFPDCHELSFDENLKYAQEIGAFPFYEHLDLRAVFSEADSELNTLKGKRILVDVSSMSRTVLSVLLSQLLDDDFFAGADIAFVYAVAKFSEPASFEYDFLDFAPIPEFSGWTASPEKPMAMVLGLGYEADHAVGAVEYLDPSATFCFFPKGTDHRFVDAVKKSNEPLLDQIKPSRIINYSVLDPLHTFSLLSSIMHSLLETARFVLVPMGPKIFVALCLVCQRVHGDEVSVWRASGHSRDSLKDVDAEGPITGFWVRRGVF
ncbi:hypothetical protein [Pseudophaeobacter arcticus]|uniref:hypothetical protein n=1 Tax=Pseudophaeobacter arcticus TaxID=385492 RepID=UPI003A97BCD2